MDPIGFQDAVMTGLARDGGLMIPNSVPDVNIHLESWKSLSYTDLAYEIMKLFVDVPSGDLRSLVNTSYATFRHDEITPLVDVGPIRILELFHGPTLAFKDVALQFLGNLFEYILERTGASLNIVAATSGDTGSAAIYGVRGRPHINIFVMHPHNRVSPLQERQMTSVLDQNVFNLAVEGSFDDCQNIMKGLFGDLEFKDHYALGAVNSVNWSRVLSQVVYYFYGAFRAMEQTGAEQVQFSVPTGNFGDILAGYYAWKMGLPIHQLILATNENDILSRFFNAGVYGIGDVKPTISPSMDIQVASNFERYLYYKLGEDARCVVEKMDEFSSSGVLTVPVKEGASVDALFKAGAGDTATTLKTIRRYHKDYDYLLDPHTAVGVHVAEQNLSDKFPTICLATAHPAKFNQAIIDATGEDLGHHDILDKLLDAETRCDNIAADQQAVKEYVVEKVSSHQ